VPNPKKKFWEQTPHKKQRQDTHRHKGDRHQKKARSLEEWKKNVWVREKEREEELDVRRSRASARGEEVGGGDEIGLVKAGGRASPLATVRRL